MRYEMRGVDVELQMRVEWNGRDDRLSTDDADIDVDLEAHPPQALLTGRSTGTLGATITSSLLS